MKRTQLARRSPLKGRSRLLATRLKPLSDAATEFKRPHWGHCQVCGEHGPVRRHHVIREQHVRAEGGDIYDTRNSMWVGVEGLTCDCHEKHHNASRRIPARLIPAQALSFAIALMGVDQAHAYFEREYGEVD